MQNGAIASLLSENGIGDKSVTEAALAADAEAVQRGQSAFQVRNFVIPRHATVIEQWQACVKELRAKVRSYANARIALARAEARVRSASSPLSRALVAVGIKDRFELVEAKLARIDCEEAVAGITADINTIATEEAKLRPLIETADQEKLELAAWTSKLTREIVSRRALGLPVTCDVLNAALAMPSSSGAAALGTRLLSNDSRQNLISESENGQ